MAISPQTDTTSAVRSDDWCCLTPTEGAELSGLLPRGEAVHTLSEFFRVLGDPSRIRIVAALATGPICVNDLATLVGLKQSTVSHQLKALRAARVVSYERRGRMVFYRLHDAHVEELLQLGLVHVREGTR